MCVYVCMCERMQYVKVGVRVLNDCISGERMGE